MLCILSDTHDNVRSTEAAVAVIRSLSPELVIHCGDITSPPLLHLFRDLPARFILGNNERDPQGLNKLSEELGFGPIGKELELEHRGKSFYVYHGHKEHILDEMAGSQLYDYVLHGHTHTQRNEVLGRTRIINPGACHRARIHTIATLDLETDQVEFIEI